jgi:hypothetical protein
MSGGGDGYGGSGLGEGGGGGARYVGDSNGVLLQFVDHVPQLFVVTAPMMADVMLVIPVGIAGWRMHE